LCHIKTQALQFSIRPSDVATFNYMVDVLPTKIRQQALNRWRKVFSIMEYDFCHWTFGSGRFDTKYGSHLRNVEP